jgi:hypothetical protein
MRLSSIYPLKIKAFGAIVARFAWGERELSGSR